MQLTNAAVHRLDTNEKNGKWLLAQIDHGENDKQYLSCLTACLFLIDRRPVAHVSSEAPTESIFQRMGGTVQRERKYFVSSGYRLVMNIYLP